MDEQTQMDFDFDAFSNVSWTDSAQTSLTQNVNTNSSTTSLNENLGLSLNSNDDSSCNLQIMEHSKSMNQNQQQQNHFNHSHFSHSFEGPLEPHFEETPNLQFPYSIPPSPSSSSSSSSPLASNSPFTSSSPSSSSSSTPSPSHSSNKNSTKSIITPTTSINTKKNSIPKKNSKSIVSTNFKQTPFHQYSGTPPPTPEKLLNQQQQQQHQNSSNNLNQQSSKLQQQQQQQPITQPNSNFGSPFISTPLKSPPPSLERRKKNQKIAHLKKRLPFTPEPTHSQTQLPPLPTNETGDSLHSSSNQNSEPALENQFSNYENPINRGESFLTENDPNLHSVNILNLENHFPSEKISQSFEIKPSFFSKSRKNSTSSLTSNFSQSFDDYEDSSTFDSPLSTPNNFDFHHGEKDQSSLDPFDQFNNESFGELEEQIGKVNLAPKASSNQSCQFNDQQHSNPPIGYFSSDSPLTPPPLSLLNQKRKRPLKNFKRKIKSEPSSLSSSFNSSPNPSQLNSPSDFLQKNLESNNKLKSKSTTTTKPQNRKTQRKDQSPSSPSIKQQNQYCAEGLDSPFFPQCAHQNQNQFIGEGNLQQNFYQDDVDQTQGDSTQDYDDESTQDFDSDIENSNFSQFPCRCAPGPDKKYKCTYPNCDKDYKNANGLKYHIIHGHIQEEKNLQNTKTKPYQCNFPGCTKGYKNANGLKYHVKHVHSQLRCSVCNGLKKDDTFPSSSKNNQPINNNLPIDQNHIDMETSLLEEMNPDSNQVMSSETNISLDSNHDHQQHQQHQQQPQPQDHHQQQEENQQHQQQDHSNLNTNSTSNLNNDFIINEGKKVKDHSNLFTPQYSFINSSFTPIGCHSEVSSNLNLDYQINFGTTQQESSLPSSTQTELSSPKIFHFSTKSLGRRASAPHFQSTSTNQLKIIDSLQPKRKLERCHSDFSDLSNIPALPNTNTNSNLNCIQSSNANTISKVPKPIAKKQQSPIILKNTTNQNEQSPQLPTTTIPNQDLQNQEVTQPLRHPIPYNLQNVQSYTKSIYLDEQLKKAGQIQRKLSLPNFPLSSMESNEKFIPRINEKSPLGPSIYNNSTFSISNVNSTVNSTKKTKKPSKSKSKPKSEEVGKTPNLSLSQPQLSNSKSHKSSFSTLPTKVYQPICPKPPLQPSFLSTGVSLNQTTNQQQQNTMIVNPLNPLPTNRIEVDVSLFFQQVAQESPTFS